MADLGNRANVNSAIDLLLDDLAPDNSILPSDHNGLLKDILDTLANGLSVTLRTGNTTSGQNLQVTSGDSIQFDNSTFLGSLSSATLTGNQSYLLPDKSGTIALTSEASILAVDSQTLGGNFTHDLNSNTLTFDNGVINITNGGLGVLGAGNYTSDGTPTLMSFIDSSSQPIMIIRNDGSIAVGNTIADVSSVFDITSTTRGFLKPRMTTVQRDAISTPAVGLEIFNTTTNQSEFYNGSSWSAVGGGSSIYSADDTIGSGRVATLTDNLRFDNIGTTALDFIEFKHSSNSGSLDFFRFYNQLETIYTDITAGGNTTTFGIKRNGTNVAEFNLDNSYFYGSSTGYIRLSTDVSGADNWQLRAERQGFGNGFSLRNETTSNYAFHVNKTNDVILRAFATVGSEEISLQGDTMIGNTTDLITFYGGTLTAKQTVTGSRGGNVALTDLLTKLANLGLITDSTTA